jgi:hypothetical protein
MRQPWGAQILNRTLLVKSDPQMHQEKFDLA